MAQKCILFKIKMVRVYHFQIQLLMDQVDYIFNQLEASKQNISSRYILMTYFNIICSYGEKEFLDRCIRSSVYGLIIPDLPYELAQKFKNKFSTHQVEIISLIAMTTNEERMKTIAQQAEGFIYTITMNATTGKNEQFHPELKRKVKLIKEISKVPVVAGFGIKNYEPC